MGYLINGYKIMAKEAGDYIVEHRAGIGTAISIGGTIVSNILSTRAGAKSARMIDAKQNELGRPLNLQEKAQLCWKNHIWSAGTAAVSCVGAGYSHNEHVKDFNKVAMAYSGVKKLYDASRQATREVLGEKKAIELQDKLNQKHLEDNPEIKKQLKEMGPNPDPSTLRKFWEPITGISFFSTRDKIDLALKEMKSELTLLPPRNPKQYSMLSREECCIKLSRLFDLLDVEIPQSVAMSDTMHYMAFLKGCAENGVDDDDISVTYTPMTIDEDTMETCAALNWTIAPSDYRYGAYIKAGNF